VLLDIGAQASVFGNKNLLTDLIDLDKAHRFNGTGGGSMIAMQTGKFHGIAGIDYAPQSDVNILSCSQMIASGARVAYCSESNQFKMLINEQTFVFCSLNGLYVYNPTFIPIPMQERGVETYDVESLEERKLMSEKGKVDDSNITEVEHIVKKCDEREDEAEGIKKRDDEDEDDYRVESKWHSEMEVKLGHENILAVSNEHECMIASSSKAEFIGMSHLIKQAFKLKNKFERAYGQKVKMKVYLDYMVPVNMMINGTSDTKREDINIEVAWLKQTMEAGEFSIDNGPFEVGESFDTHGNDIGLGVGIQTVTKERAEESEISVVTDLNPIVHERWKSSGNIISFFISLFMSLVISF